MTKQLSVTYACGAQDYWDLEPDGSLRIDIPQAQVVVAEYEANQMAALRKGTHPMTSNDSPTTVEGTHMTTPHPGKRPATPTIPEAVHKLTISRGTRENSPMYVTLEGTAWHMSITTTDAEVLTRVHEIAAAMEAVK